MAFISHNHDTLELEWAGKFRPYFILSYVLYVNLNA